jgi:hypothetical protein
MKERTLKKISIFALVTLGVFSCRPRTFHSQIKHTEQRPSSAEIQATSEDTKARLAWFEELAKEGKFLESPAYYAYFATNPERTKEMLVEWYASPYDKSNPDGQGTVKWHTLKNFRSVKNF